MLGAPVLSSSYIRLRTASDGYPRRSMTRVRPRRKSIDRRVRARRRPSARLVPSKEEGSACRRSIPRSDWRFAGGIELLRLHAQTMGQTARGTASFGAPLRQSEVKGRSGDLDAKAFCGYLGLRSLWGGIFTKSLNLHTSALNPET